MIFKDGLRKAGFFKENIYKTPLLTIKEFEEYHRKMLKADPNKIIPEAFIQEIKEYVGLLAATEDNSKYIDKQFGSIDKEDLMATN